LSLVERWNGKATVRMAMIDRSLSYAAWRKRRLGRGARVACLEAGLPPFRRRRLRSPGEAAFLRRIGTPESLVGPVGSDDAVAQERRELLEVARRLRAGS
jgi:hypothetical protein